MMLEKIVLTWMSSLTEPCIARTPARYSRMKPTSLLSESAAASVESSLPLAPCIRAITRAELAHGSSASVTRGVEGREARPYRNEEECSQGTSNGRRVTVTSARRTSGAHQHGGTQQRAAGHVAGRLSQTDGELGRRALVVDGGAQRVICFLLLSVV